MLSLRKYDGKLRRRLGKIFCVFTVILVMALLNNHRHHVYAEEFIVQEGDSIQAVINQAAHGDVITILEGIYHENLFITKKLTVIGKDGATVDGNGKGNVITIRNVDNLSLTGLTIRNSGKRQNESGIYIEKGMNNRIENNTLVNNHFGMYIDKGINHHVENNQIYGSDAHYSSRGNGVHLFKGGDHLIESNTIEYVQDGVYFDFTKNVHVAENQISNSRYALHYMFSEQMVAEKNDISKNITGLMVMDSEHLQFFNNTIADHFHFRGFGMLIYHANNIYIEGNEIIRNSTGMSFDKAISTESVKNIIAANQVGLEFIGENEQNIFTENNFIANIVQTKISNEKMRLDNGIIGNYWDDYGKFDVTGDSIGEERYKAGSLYDQLLRSQPAWQFFFESPAVIMWSKAESMFPSIGRSDVYDELPAVEPFPLGKDMNEKKQPNKLIVVIGVFFIMIATITLVKGRKYT